jgi:hypothetical protein
VTASTKPATSLSSHLSFTTLLALLTLRYSSATKRLAGTHTAVDHERTGQEHRHELPARRLQLWPGPFANPPRVAVACKQPCPPYRGSSHDDEYLLSCVSTRQADAGQQYSYQAAPPYASQSYPQAPQQGVYGQPQQPFAPNSSYDSNAQGAYAGQTGQFPSPQHPAGAQQPLNPGAYGSSPPTQAYGTSTGPPQVRCWPVDETFAEVPGHVHNV